MFLPLGLALLVAAAPPKPPLTKPVLLHELAGHTATVRGADFSPDGKTVATVCDDGLLRVWELHSGKALVAIKVAVGLGSVQFSPDGSRLLAAGSDGAVRLFDAKSGKKVKTFRGHTDSLYVARFTPDGKQIVSTGLDTKTRIWNVATGKQVRSLSGQSCYALAVTAGGKFAVTAGENRALTLWDLSTGKEVRQMHGHTGVVVWLEFSFDGRTIASCSYDKTIRLWETRTGKERFQLAGFTNSPRVCVFSRDGRFLAVGDYAGNTRLYDVGTGKEVFLEGSSASIYALAISRDGRYLVSGGLECLRLWDVSAVTRRRDEAMSKSTFADHWNELGADDAKTGFRAVVALSSPGASKHFPGRFAPPKPPSDEEKKRAPRLIRDLTEDDESKHKKATDELARLGQGVALLLEQALKQETDADAKVRLIVVLSRVKVSGSEEVRMLRAIEVFERVGTPEAVKLLSTLAKGVGGAGAAAEAKQALDRLKRREAR